MATNQEPLYKRARNKIGRPPTFDTAEELLDRLVDYCEDCDRNPIKIDVRSKIKRTSKDGGNSDTSEANNMTVKRPYTLDGFCLFAGIFMPWATFKNNAKRRKDWAEFEIAINTCEAVIRDNQITGAMIGVFSERLTARLNGIAERVEAEVEQRQTTISFEQYCRMLRGETIEN